MTWVSEKSWEYSYCWWKIFCTRFTNTVSHSLQSFHTSKRWAKLTRNFFHHHNVLAYPEYIKTAEINFPFSKPPSNPPSFPPEAKPTSRMTPKAKARRAWSDPLRWWFLKRGPGRVRSRGPRKPKKIPLIFWVYMSIYHCILVNPRG